MDCFGPSRFALITLIAFVMMSMPVIGMGAELRPFRLPEAQIYQPPPYPSYGPPPRERRGPPPPRDRRDALPPDAPRFGVDREWRERFEDKSSEAERLLKDLEWD